MKVLSRVRSHLHVLQDLNVRVRVTLVWIPDTSIFTTMILQTKEPKTQFKDADDIPLSELTLTVSKKIITKQCQESWQRQWDRSSTARSTYDLILQVGDSRQFPMNHCCTISYVRLLLDDSMLNIQQ